MKVKKKWKNEPYVSKDEYDELVKGGKDVFFSACVIVGSALGAGLIILVMFLTGRS